ncbi:hypothetical protein [Alistipes sp.]|uniref:hypothetical protein n=1 Tax=Alistipes sp. TaxID=1872444 RepID=UPI003AEF1C1F
MELKIDGQVCDRSGDRIAVPGYDAAKMCGADGWREGRRMRLSVPATPRNDAILNHPRDPHAAVRFQDAQHRAELTADGAVLLAGTVRLLAASDEGYTLEIRDGGAGWAHQAAQRMFNALGVEYAASLTPSTILASWTEPTPVRFFPIHRDEYPQRNSPSDLLPAERMLSVDDYHPFLHIATLVGTVFAEAGYYLESRFFASEFFRSLYLSGAYPARDTRAQAARMGFFARRLGAATAQANSSGRVYADPRALYNSVGNIVETATPQTVDSDGEPIPELANNGGCFSLTGGAIVFTPPTEVSAGFEYYLRYTTDHRILTRTQLRGFDSVYLGPGSEMRFTLANRYEDRRERIMANYTYRIVVFDHAAGAQYRLTFTRDGAAGSAWTEFAARSAQVTTPALGTFADPVLWVRSGSGWTVYAGDWALYDGYVGETGQTTVELRVRTAAEVVSPAAPKRFDTIYFFGAEAGMSLTLHKECSLQPRFVAGPGFGSPIRFADVAQHRIRQAELLEALAHLFNLRFWSDEATRTVYAEPADDLFGAGPQADWRARSDFSQPVVREPIVPEIHERRTWCYGAGDGAVTRFAAQTGTELGAWTACAPSPAAKQGEQVLRNALFHPTLSSAGHYLNAPSALLLQMGDRDAAQDDGSGFTPRIVRYAGLHPLPQNERWGYPSTGAAYPLAAFHFAGDAAAEAFTLCFEDRDGAQGLNRYYRRQVAQEESLERITLSVRLAPHEFEALFTPGCGAPELRSVFRIDTGAGCVRATLQSIGDYDPDARTARCTFIRLPED